MGQIKAKFHVEPPWERVAKICSNGPGHITKMAAKPIYGKKALKVFFFRTEWPRSLKLGKQHWALEYYQVCSNDDPRLTFDPFTQRSTLVPCAFVSRKA